MQRTRKLGFDIVQFDAHGTWQILEDSHAWDGRRFDGFVKINIDANDYTCAVGDCLWSLHGIRQAHLHANMNN